MNWEQLPAGWEMRDGRAVRTDASPPERHGTVRDLHELAMSEAALLSTITQTGRLFGWHVMHITDSRSQNATGWPDLVLCDPETGRLLIWECKTETGQVTAEQTAWLDALARGGSAHVAVIRPRHLDDALAALANGDTSKLPAWQAS